MAPDQELQPGEPARTGDRAPHRWPVWRLPAPLLAAVMLVETAAAALLVADFMSRPGPTWAQLWTAGVLCALGGAYTEVSVGVERERRRLGGVGYVDLSSVWTFAAALALPGALAAVVATIVMLYMWVRAWRQWVPLHRRLFSVATAVLACIATGVFLEHVDPVAGPAEHPLWVLLVAMAVYMAAYLAVDAGLIAAVVAVSVPRPAPSALLVPGPRDEYVLELGMLCMGALTAIALSLNPVLVVLMLLPMYLVLRAVLVRPLEAAASTDGKTGLLNAATWAAEAERALSGTDGGDRACSVLVLDLDHFKSVNDTYGHVIGDRVLAAAADALRRMVRAHDLVGRLGGEEFVVLLRGAAYGERGERGERSVELEAVELEVVAERIRAHVADLRLEVPAPDGTLMVADLSVSIGGAVAGPDGCDLAALLHTADTALYAAKRAGRNTVRIAVASSAQPMPVQLVPHGGGLMPGHG